MTSLDRADGVFLGVGSRAAPDEGPGSKPKKRRPLQLVPVILRAMVDRLVYVCSPGGHDDFANALAGCCRAAQAKSNKAFMQLIRGGF